MDVIRELRETWSTFKDTEPLLASISINMLNDTLRSIEPYWPANSIKSTHHEFIDDLDDPTDPITNVSQRLRIMGYAPSLVSESNFKLIGQIAARLYEDKYGVRPEVKHIKYDGSWKTINKYRRSRAPDTIDRAIKSVLITQ